MPLFLLDSDSPFNKDRLCSADSRPLNAKDTILPPAIMASPPHSSTSVDDDDNNSNNGNSNNNAFGSHPIISAFFQPDLPTFFHPPNPNPNSFKSTPNPSIFPSPELEHRPLPPAPAKNPKKRSRASRRAPTTVLTTDTSNFRSMVQEFTGIPAPPFTPRTRLDLFGPPPIIQSNSLCESLLYKRQRAADTWPGQYPLTHPLSLPTANLVNAQNPVFTFQSLIHGNAPPLHGLINNDSLQSPTAPVILPSDLNSSPKVPNESDGACTRSEGMVESWICSSD